MHFFNNTIGKISISSLQEACETERKTHTPKLLSVDRRVLLFPGLFYVLIHPDLIDKISLLFLAGNERYDQFLQFVP